MIPLIYAHTIAEFYTRIFGRNDRESGIYSKEIDWQEIRMTTGSNKLDISGIDFRIKALIVPWYCSEVYPDICEEVFGNNTLL
jgi:hypothetical protein